MKYIVTFFVIIISLSIQGQTIIGHWETFDDNTKEKKAVIEIYKTNNRYFAKIVNSFTGNKNATCNACKGDKKGKPILGLVIIENLKKDEDEFSGGSILDPENGQTYKCSLELIGSNKLKVRGYLGVSLFGRTQYWIRKK